MAARALLEVERLSKDFSLRGAGRFTAVNDVSFDLYRGRTLALVGESGCGKTTTGRLVLRLLEPSSGRIRFEGQDITGTSAASLVSVRARMQPVFQDPQGSFNPRLTIGQAIEEPLLVQGVSRSERRSRVTGALRACELEPDLARRYPHQLSGGQRQRAAIARAIVLRPKLIVADEPVSALDASIQSQILNLLLRLQAEHGISYLFISHDLAVVGHIADTVAVMYMGQIVEYGPADLVMSKPAHPYSRALLAAVPRPSPAQTDLAALAGQPPSPFELPKGCTFAGRCPCAEPRCASLRPPLFKLPGEQYSRCWLNESGADGVRGAQ